MSPRTVINRDAVHSIFRHSQLVLAALALGIGWSGQAQVLDEPVKGFQVSDHDATTGRRKWLLSGDTAQNAAKDELLLTGARMTFFDEAGRTNLIVLTPKSIYRTKAKEVVSPEAIEVTTGNGMSLEGVGFRFRQEDTSLIISNQVRATIRKDLAGSRSLLPGGTNAAAPVVALAALPTASPHQVVTVFSDQFLFQTNRGVFRERVRVVDSQGTLVCEVLTIELAQSGRQLERIVAERQVVAESGDMRASGDRGVYVLVDDEVSLTGDPSWRMGDREGRAEEFIFDRGSRHFRALRNVRMRLPPGSLNQAGFLLSERSAPAGAGASTRRPADVTCDEFEYTSGVPGTSPSVTICRGNVVIDDDRGRLRCAVLTIESSRESSRTERVVADRDVVVEQEDNRVACERAEYLAPVERIELTGRPVWKVGTREGSSDLITFDLKNRTYRAAGAVEMRLPPGAMGSSSWLLPVEENSTRNLVGAPDLVRTRDTRPVEIVADEFEFRSAPGVVGMDEGEYRGRVRIRDPKGMTLECGSLRGRMFPGSSQMQTAVAKENVVIRADGGKGERTGRGDVAIYSAEREEVELTGEEGVDILIREPAGDTQARGRKIVYARTTDIAVLSGDPRITSPSGTVTGENLVLDRSQSQLKATGNWRINVKREMLKKTETPFKLKAPSAPAKSPAT